MTTVITSSPASSSQVTKRVLFVDMDGTLVATDILWEAFLKAFKREPWIGLLLPLWLLQGKAALKRAISSRASIEAASLPYRREVVDYIQQCRDDGYSIVLATASDRVWADAVAKEVGLFDDVIASDGTNNMKGATKLAAIEAYCQEKGFGAWGYIGDSTADLHIWQRSKEVFVANASPGLLTRVRKHGEPVRIFGHKKGALVPLVKAMRPHQWVKNVLLFVPLLLARDVFDLTKLTTVVLAFLAFSLCASAVYVLNDLFDVDADRVHPRKRKRPFASGDLPLAVGPFLATGLITVGFGLTVTFLPPAFLAVLVLYMVVTTLYSTVLKSKLMVDILILAGLYTLRIFAGGVATGLVVSEWLLAFSIFMFTSLAFAKRYIEISRLAIEGKKSAKGRGYVTDDLSLIESIGPTSGYMAVLVFALYINSPGLPGFYTNKWLLWLTCPLMLYWISRLWFLAKRQELHDDPVVFAMTDRVSLMIGAVVGLAMLLAGPLW